METKKSVSAIAHPVRHEEADVARGIRASQPSLAALTIGERRQICRVDLAFALQEIAAMRTP